MRPTVIKRRVLPRWTDEATTKKERLPWPRGWGHPYDYQKAASVSTIKGMAIGLHCLQHFGAHNLCGPAVIRSRVAGRFRGKSVPAPFSLLITHSLSLMTFMAFIYVISPADGAVVMLKLKWSQNVKLYWKWLATTEVLAIFCCCCLIKLLNLILQLNSCQFNYHDNFIIINYIQLKSVLMYLLIVFVNYL